MHLFITERFFYMTFRSVIEGCRPDYGHTNVYTASRRLSFYRLQWVLSVRVNDTRWCYLALAMYRGAVISTKKPLEEYDKDSERVHRWHACIVWLLCVSLVEGKTHHLGIYVHMYNVVLLIC